MKALRRFTVRPQLPPTLQPLGALIRNLRWSWHPASQDLFADIDRQLWDRFDGDPLKLLGAVPVSRLDELAVDVSFIARMHGLAADLDHYLQDPRWYQHQQAIGEPHNRLPEAIAYFSMEFGVTEALPNYSGGLGILAGDHLKSASDLGAPIIGVGLLYRLGYFWQSLSADGWQQEHDPAHDPQGLLIERVLGADGDQVTVGVPVPGGRELTARVWAAQVGRVPLCCWTPASRPTTPFCARPPTGCTALIRTTGSDRKSCWGSAESERSPPGRGPPAIRCRRCST